jgi:hypothetical protein
LQAEAGQMYEVVITNVSGLYRYRMGDVIKVCGFHFECPIVEFMYRYNDHDISFRLLCSFDRFDWFVAFLFWLT